MANPPLAIIAFVLFFIGCIFMDFPLPGMLLALPVWFLSGFLLAVCVRQYHRDKEWDRNIFLDRTPLPGGGGKGALVGLAVWLAATVLGVSGLTMGWLPDNLTMPILGTAVYGWLPLLLLGAFMGRIWRLTTPPAQRVRLAGR